MIDYKEKIRKLLELAKSPNEHEAKAALLKARQLMAEHKLRESDCIDAGKLEVKQELTGHKCTKRKNAWMTNLSAIIAENYRCTAFKTHYTGGQYNYIGFIGLEDDFEICKLVYEYAVESVLSHCEEIRRRYKDSYPTQYITKLCDNYGYGFCSGVDDMFDLQSEENEKWGLVLVTPAEVKEAGAYMGAPKVFKKQITPEAYVELKMRMDGEQDGQNFKPHRRLARAAEENA